MESIKVSGNLLPVKELKGVLAVALLDLGHKGFTDQDAFIIGALIKDNGDQSEIVYSFVLSVT